jgi:UDP-4-amino-4,6-dideoxy-N-acetyl-beta-L-altrosamine transaminase
MTEPSLPYGRQWIDEDDIEQVVNVLRGDYITTGPMVTAFEDKLCEVTDAKHAVAVNSGTSALHALYFAAELEPGDEIITTPLTFAATSNAALYLGATVKFVDVEPDTGNIDPNLIEEAITERTKLIVPVDYAGHPAEYSAINEIAGRHGLTVVADAAHSLGATYRGQPVGKLARATEVSFHPVKPVTTAEGGAILTDDADLARRARRFQTHGITREPGELEETDPGGWHYEMRDLGYNYRLTDLQSALGLSQLDKLESFIDRRRQIAQTYLEALDGVDLLTLPTEREHVKSGWHLFVVLVNDPAIRKPLFDKLRNSSLGVQVHYIPVYQHPYYQRLGYQNGLCPIAEDFFARAISLPIYPKMTDQNAKLAIERIQHCINEISA